MYTAQVGFTLIELMIVIAIIGILGATAVPAYQNHVRSSAYTDVISAMTSYKTAVDICYAEQGTLEPCDAGSVGIPIAPKASNAKAFNTLSVFDGVITAVPNNYKGISNVQTCILTPNVVNGSLAWSYSGGCVSASYIKN